MEVNNFLLSEPGPQFLEMASEWTVTTDSGSEDPLVHELLPCYSLLMAWNSLLLYQDTARAERLVLARRFGMAWGAVAFGVGGTLVKVFPDWGIPNFFYLAAMGLCLTAVVASLTMRRASGAEVRASLWRGAVVGACSMLGVLVILGLLFGLMFLWGYLTIVC